MIQSKSKDGERPVILLTNDDGYFADGIERLSDAVRDLARFFIVSPDREKSATSLSLTLRRPLRVQKIKPHIYAVDGTPADCIYLALKKLLPEKPDLLISGLNHGPNLGQQDISYSGTVAAAVQGAFLGIPSLAASVTPGKNGIFDFDPAAGFLKEMASRLLKRRLPRGILLNINFPPLPYKGIRITRLGEKRYDPEIIEKRDPRNVRYYWIGTGRPKAIGNADSDVHAVRKGYISVTPLHKDLTDYGLLKASLLEKLIP